MTAIAENDNILMRKQRFVSLGEIIEKALVNFKKERNSPAEKIIREWKDIVGTEIAKVARPVKIKFGTIFVNVENSAWLQELFFLEREILNKLNKQTKGKPIKKICFRVGQIIK